MKISPSRHAAFEILQRIETESSFSSILLPQYERSLNQLDASLCHNLTLGVLRQKLYLDRIISQFTKKDLEKFDSEVLTALRIGLFQILFLDKIPPYSAINESVNLVKHAKKKSAAGLVNAVLRRASNESPELVISDDVERLSVMSSHPKWLIDKWIRQFGFSETRNLAESNNLISNTSFRLTKRFHGSPGAIRDRVVKFIDDAGSDVEESGLIGGCYSVSRLTEQIKSFADEGLIYFQDPASQLVAASIEVKSGDRFLDLCASPGGKSSFIAGRRDIENALLVAGDLYPHRIRLLRENLGNQGITRQNLVQYDAVLPLPFESGSFDTVLVDAPCSGTGTIRHNPEIRYTLKPDDIEGLSAKQLTLLKNASYLIKPGGQLVYATCSFEKEENEDVIAKFLQAEDQFTTVEPPVPRKHLTPEGFLRTYPHIDNTDGFFLSFLIRSG